jgi:hypothetical protein
MLAEEQREYILDKMGEHYNKHQFIPDGKMHNFDSYQKWKKLLTRYLIPFIRIHLRTQSRHPLPIRKRNIRLLHSRKLAGCMGISLP